MNRKFEDKLAQLAFGDLSPDEARRIEALAQRDPEARAALDLYRGMQTELRSLRSVPEDQMSKERLRDAILAEGLKPEGERTRAFGWVWMPATAFALVLAVLVLKPSPAGEPKLVLPETAPQSSMVALNPPAEHPSVVERATMRHPATVAAPAPDPVLTPVVAAPSPRATPRSAPRRPLRRAPSVAKADEERLAVEDSAWKDLVASIDTPASSAADTVLPSASSPSSTSSNPPLVMIDDSVDDSTGTHPAMEVGASNVLIGG